MRFERSFMSNASTTKSCEMDHWRCVVATQAKRTRYNEVPQYEEGLYELGSRLYAWMVPNGSWGESDAGLIQRRYHGCLLFLEESHLPGSGLLSDGERTGIRSSLGIGAPPPCTCRLPLRSDSAGREVPRRQIRRGIPYIRHRSPSLDWPRSAPKVTVGSVQIQRAAQENKPPNTSFIEQPLAHKRELPEICKNE